MLSKNVILGLGASTLTYGIDVLSKADQKSEPVELLLAQIRVQAELDHQTHENDVVTLLNFAASNNRNYSTTTEVEMRIEVLTENNKRVSILNEANKGSDVKFASNFSSDMTDDEFAARHGLSLD